MSTALQRLEYFLIGFSGTFSGTEIPEVDDEHYLAGLLAEVAGKNHQGSLLEGLTGLRHRFDEGFSTLLMLPQETKAAFLRGMFGGLVYMGMEPSGRPYFAIRRPDSETPSDRDAWLGILAKACGAPLHTALTGRISGLVALDAAWRILGGDGPALPTQKRALGQWCTRVSHFETSYTPGAEIKVQRVHPDAQLPKKERISDSGYDLTLLYVKSSFGRTVLYGTGLIVEPPVGWYMDVVPRSSIIKRGYILANSVGIIDQSYRGEILVPLIKMYRNTADLELPARVAQMIPRPIVHFPVVESPDLSATERGSGGFGSTGK